MENRLITIRWTFDERIEDGLYAAYALKHMKKLVEDPVKHRNYVMRTSMIQSLRDVEQVP